MLKLVLAAACCAWAGAAAAEPLTFADALARAARLAPSIEAAGLQIDAARASARAAGELPDPKLSVGVTDFPVSGPLAGRPQRDDFSMVTLGYAQEVPNRAKRRARTAQAQAAITESEALLLAERRAVRVATALAWIDLYYAERKLASLQTLRAEVQVDERTAPARLTSGAARPATALEPQQALADLEDREAMLRAARLKARAELGRWIGPAGASGAPEPSGPAPDTDVDPVALRAALDDLPQLAVKAAAVRRAEAARGGAQADTHSDWGYEMEYAHRDPRFGDYVSGKLSFSLPLFTRNRQDPLIAARGAELGRALAEREATRRQLTAALDGELAEHAMHHAMLARARDGLVPLARRRAELETASYQDRTAGLSDVLVARRAAVEAELDALDREAEAVRDGVRLNLTYGEEPQ